ncbi:mitochondrial import inner membrane translocase subunit Tim8 B-like [Calliopsis andreniformis]|uniref:mitochondrial import inner membrane translocase subunit Tim8 B-like n=1 Tax=Calliopsis andreniformis TaxID=337506 RepID=UPI003FCE072C
MLTKFPNRITQINTYATIRSFLSTRIITITSTFYEIFLIFNLKVESSPLISSINVIETFSLNHPFLLTSLTKITDVQKVSDHRFLAFSEHESWNKELVYKITDICWEICVDSPSFRLGTKVEQCLKNCVERFIDTTNFITSRLKRIL